MIYQHINEDYPLKFKEVLKALKDEQQKGNKKRIISLAAEAGKIHLNINNSIEDIARISREGNKENIHKVLELIPFFKEEEQFILYINLLYHTLFTNENLPDRKDTAELILNHLDNYSDSFPVDLVDNIPLNYLFRIMLKLGKIGLPVDGLIKRISFNFSSREERLYGYESNFTKEDYDDEDSESLMNCIIHNSSIPRPNKKRLYSAMQKEYRKHGKNLLPLEDFIDNNLKSIDMYKRDENSEKIVLDLINQGKIKEAETFIKEIDEEDKRGGLYIHIILFLLKDREEEAEYFIKKIIEKYNFYVKKLLKELIKLDKIDIALNISKKSGQINRDYFHYKISSKLAENGKIEEALSEAYKVQDRTYKGKSLVSVIIALDKSGFHERAELLIEQVIAIGKKKKRNEILFSRTVFYSDMGTYLIDRGNRKIAGIFIDKAIEMAESEVGFHSKLCNLELIVTRLLWHKEVDMAIEILERLKKISVKTKILSYIVSELTHMGQMDKASDVLILSIFTPPRLLPVKRTKFYTCYKNMPNFIPHMVYVIAESGDIQKAINIIKTIPSEYKTNTLLKMESSLKRHGKIENIIGFSRIKNFSEKIYPLENPLTLYKLIEEAVDKGEIDKSLEIVEKINNNFYRAKSFILIASQFRKQNDLAKAELYIKEAIKEVNRICYIYSITSSILIKIASELIKLNDFTKALNIAESIEYSFYTLRVDEIILYKFAERLLSEGKVEEVFKLGKVDIMKPGYRYLLNHDRMDEVLTMVKDMENNELKINIYCLIAAKFKENGDMESKNLFIEKAINEVVRYGIFASVELDNFKYIAGYLTDEGLLEEALEITDKYPSEELDIYEVIVSSLVGRGEMEKALEIEEKYMKNHPDKEFVRRLIRKETEKKETLEIELEMMERNDQLDEYDLEKVVLEFLEKEEFRRIIDASERIKNPDNRDYYLKCVRFNLCLLEQFDEAINAACKIKEDFLRDEMIEYIAGDLIDTGHFNRSFDLFNLAEKPHTKGDILSYIIKYSDGEYFPYLIDFLRNKVTSEVIKTEGYKALLEVIFENYILIPKIIPEIIDDICYNKGLLEFALALYCMYLFLYEEKSEGNKDLLEELKEVVEINQRDPGGYL